MHHGNFSWGLVNGIMLNNPGIALHAVLSFIYYINQNYTDGKPMKTKEMVNTITAEFNRITGTGEFKGTGIKTVHINPVYDKATRQRTAASVNGRLKTERSIKDIKIVFEALKEQGLKPTAQRVAEVLDGGRSICLVKKYLVAAVAEVSFDGFNLKKETIVDQEIRFKDRKFGLQL